MAKSSLKQKDLKASRIEQVMAMAGWKDIQEIIQDKYNSLINTLLEKEDASARGGINAITEIMDDISRELQFGKVAREKYRTQYLTVKPQGE